MPSDWETLVHITRLTTLSALSAALLLPAPQAVAAPGGRVTGDADMANSISGTINYFNLMVSEKNGFNASGMMFVERPRDGLFWEGDVICAKVYLDDTAEIVVEVTSSGNGAGGPHPTIAPGAFLGVWFEDNGPSDDRAITGLVNDELKNDFCLFAGGAEDRDPSLVDQLERSQWLLDTGDIDVQQPISEKEKFKFVGPSPKDKNKDKNKNAGKGKNPGQSIPDKEKEDKEKFKNVGPSPNDKNKNKNKNPSQPFLGK